MTIITSKNQAEAYRLSFATLLTKKPCVINAVQRVLAALILVIVAASCSDKEVKEPIASRIEVDHPFVLVLGTDYNSYVFPNVASFDDGVFDSKAESSQSIQMSGDRRIEFVDDQYMYSFVYNQDNPGKSRSFEISDGYFVGRNEYDVSNSIQSRAVFGDDLIGTYSDREYDPQAIKPGEIPNTYVKFFRFSLSSDGLSEPVKWPSYNFDHTNELAYVTDLRAYKNYLFAGIRTIKGYLPENTFPEPILLFDSDFTDRTYVGVFDNDLNLVKIIKDEKRTGMVGGMIRATGKTGIEVLSNGEIYAFCSAFSSKERPSGVLKVNPETLTFDAHYFFDISKASGGHKLFRAHYLGGSFFCLQLFTDLGTDVTKYYDAPGAAARFALFDVASGDFQMIASDLSNVKSITDPYFDAEKQLLYWGVNFKDRQPAVYKLDITAKKMSQGLRVEGQEIRALGKLKIR